MLRLLDRLPNGKVVQKITKPNGQLVCYQSGYTGDEGLMQKFKTLQEARFNVGLVQAKEE